ncbi:NB-ARC domain-containing protein [Streptomyces stramineus]
MALFRSVLADRRVLIVLDDVRAFAPIRALIPGGSRCGVVVTSRGQLEELVVGHGAVPVHLEALTKPEATELLGHVIGAQRVDAARPEAERLVELCDRLPLTVRIAAARLASKPHWPVGHLAGRLADERLRLDALSSGSRSCATASRGATAPWSPPPPCCSAARPAGRPGLHLLGGGGPAGRGHLHGGRADGAARGRPAAPGGGLRRDRTAALPLPEPAAAVRAGARGAGGGPGDAAGQREAVERALESWLTIAEHARRREFGREHVLVRGDTPGVRWTRRSSISSPPRRLTGSRPNGSP